MGYHTKYKIYIEFLGKWNSEEGRKKYAEKMRIYELNKIPCVYIYPDNLGILGFIFRRRIKKELQKCPNLKWQLFKLNWEIFMEKFGLGGLVLVFIIYFVNNWIWKIGLSIILILHIYTSIKNSFLKK